MVGRSVDVSLRIKAQDEASKALDAVGKALKDLAGAQGALAGGSNGVSKFVEGLSKNVDGLSALFNKLETSLNTANRAYQAQAQQLAAVNSSIEDRRRRLEALKKAEEDLQRIQGSYKKIGPSKQDSFIGPVPPRLSGVRSQIATESNALAKEEAAVDKLIGKIADARDATQQIRNVQGQVATALNATTNAFIQQANALDKLADAEKRAAAEAMSRQQSQSLRAHVEAVTGVNRTGTPGSLRDMRQRDLETTFAPVFAAEDVKAIKDAEQAFVAFEARAKQGGEALRQVQKYARDVAEALDPTAKVTRLVAEEQARLAQAVKLGALSQQQADTALLKYKQNLDGSALATERQSREFEQLSTYVQELRRDFDRAGYSERFLAQETEKLNRAVKAGILSQNEYGKALESVKRKAEQLGEQSNPQLFGLNPYQTQNLLFQFNDVATQLASGTSLTQTLAQQGGQILQLFPKVGNAIAGSFANAGPYIAAVVAAIGSLVVGITEAIDAAGRLRQFEAVLRASADGASYNAEQVINAAKAMREFGVSIEDAMKVAQIAIKSGFDQTEITSFGEAAKGLSVVLGSDIPTAAQQLADALTGGYDALVALDKQTNVFTDSELDSIRAMIESGNVLGANAEATRILTERYSKLAEDAEGPWQKAINGLTAAWDSLKTSLANSTVIQGLVSGLTAVANAISDIIKGVDRLSANPVGSYIFSSGFALNPGAAIAAAAMAGKGQAQAPVSAPSQSNSKGELESLLNGKLKGIVTKTNNGFVGNNATVASFYAAEIARANQLLVQTTRQQTELSKKADDTVEATLRQMRAEGKVTSEKEKQARLAEDLKRIRLEVQSQFPQASAAKQEELAQARLAQVTEKYNDQLKQVADSRKRAADQAKREAEQQEKMRNTMQFQAKELLRNVEGFKSKAYWDVNAYRAGYGSDTVTRADGSVQRVTANTSVTRADAERDLARRIEEFANVVKQQIGTERFGQFSAPQQAALVSIAYNYGELPKRILDEVKRGTNAEIAAAVRGLRNDNGGANAKRRDREAAILGTENLSVEQGAKQAAEDTQAKLDKYNTTLDEKLRREERSIINQKALVGLQGDALRAEIERQKIEEAIAQATDDLRRTTGNELATLTQDQIDRITVDVKARLKLDEPSKVFGDLQKQLDSLQGYRTTLTTQLQTAQQTGDTGGVSTLKDQIEEVDARIRAAAGALSDFLNTPGNPEALGLYGAELDNMLLKFDQLQQKTADWELSIGGATISAQEFANAFTTTAVSAIDQFAQAIANGRNAFGALWDAFRQFAADFLLQIARMIQQQIIFNLVSGLLKGLTGGLTMGAGVTPSASSFGSAFAGLKAHSGGVVGNASTYGSDTGIIPINPAWFANAARYHSGGIAGLKPGEVPAVLMRGEEVLTRDDPRHIMNGGGGTGNVKIVNAFDEADVISKAMETKAGEKAVLNLVRRNPRAFRAAMG